MRPINLYSSNRLLRVMKSLHTDSSLTLPWVILCNRLAKIVHGSHKVETPLVGSALALVWVNSWLESPLFQRQQKPEDLSYGLLFGGSFFSLYTVNIKWYFYNVESTMVAAWQQGTCRCQGVPLLALEAMLGALDSTQVSQQKGRCHWYASSC